MEAVRIRMRSNLAARITHPKCLPASTTAFLCLEVQSTTNFCRCQCILKGRQLHIDDGDDAQKVPLSGTSITIETADELCRILPRFRMKRRGVYCPRPHQPYGGHHESACIRN